MAKYPAATFVGSPNETPGGMVDYRFFVLHIECGTESGTISWFKNPKSQVSAHFSIGKDGKVYQHVDTHDKAWAEVRGNAHAISCEFEGQPGDKLTSLQFESAAHLLAWVHKTHGTQLVATHDAVNGHGVIGHGEGGAEWGGHTGCPGSGILGQRPALISRAEAVLGMKPAAAPAPAPAPAPTHASTALPSWYHRELKRETPMLHGDDVAHMQGCVGVRSDGWFGDDTEKALKGYQSRHGLTPDGICGPKTAEKMQETHPS